MSTAMRVALLVLVVVAAAAGIWFGVWLFDAVTAPDEPAPPLGRVVSALTR